MPGSCAGQWPNEKLRPQPGKNVMFLTLQLGGSFPLAFISGPHMYADIYIQDSMAIVWCVWCVPGYLQNWNKQRQCVQTQIIIRQLEFCLSAAQILFVFQRLAIIKSGRVSGAKCLFKLANTHTHTPIGGREKENGKTTRTANNVADGSKRKSFLQKEKQLENIYIRYIGLLAIFSVCVTPSLSLSLLLLPFPLLFLFLFLQLSACHPFTVEKIFRPCIFDGLN